MPDPLRIAFLGCGFITRVHSRNLRRFNSGIECSYASRDKAKAERFRAMYGGARSYGDYAEALSDPRVDAVVVAIPPKFHLDLTLKALAAGKHVLVEKPAFLTTPDYRVAIEARDRAKKIVLVGENDHYKPLAVKLRQLLADDVIGDMLLASFSTIAWRMKRADDWRNDESIAGGDAFFEEGIHWLHVANSLGPKITRATGFRPTPLRKEPDSRAKTMLASFAYDNGAVGTVMYSREIPSIFKGLRMSKIMGREGAITFESNGAILFVHGRGAPQLTFPGFRDIRGYQAMYRDLRDSIQAGRQPEMSLERALEDQLLMDQIYGSLNDHRS